TRSIPRPSVNVGCGAGAVVLLAKTQMTVPGAAPAARNDRGALTHDDRLDAVAGAVAHFQRAMMMDVDQAAKAMRDEEMLAEIEDFIEGFNQPTFRGMGVDGFGSRPGQASAA